MEQPWKLQSSLQFGGIRSKLRAFYWGAFPRGLIESVTLLETGISEQVLEDGRFWQAILDELGQVPTSCQVLCEASQPIPGVRWPKEVRGCQASDQHPSPTALHLGDPVLSSS